MECPEAAPRYIALQKRPSVHSNSNAGAFHGHTRRQSLQLTDQRGTSVCAQEWKAPPPGAHWQHPGQLPAPPRGEASFYMQWPMLLQLHLVLMCHPLGQCRLKSCQASGDTKTPSNQTDVDLLTAGLCCRSASRTSRSW